MALQETRVGILKPANQDKINSISRMNKGLVSRIRSVVTEKDQIIVKLTTGSILSLPPLFSSVIERASEAFRVSVMYLDQPDKAIISLAIQDDSKGKSEALVVWTRDREGERLEERSKATITLAPGQEVKDVERESRPSEQSDLLHSYYNI